MVGSSLYLRPLMVDAAGEGAQVRLVHLLDLVVGVEVILARRRVRPVHKAVNRQPIVLRMPQLLAQTLVAGSPV